MTIALPIPEDKKLRVTHRVESGCLGPRGQSLLIGFCISAEKVISSMYSDFIHWKIIPRMDKNDPEIDYGLLGHNMTEQQVDRYLGLFDLTRDQFEAELSEKIGFIIEKYVAEH